jgi:hypothetical protein
VEEAKAVMGKADGEAGVAEVVDFGDGGDAVEEDFRFGRGFGGVALNGDGEAFAEEVIEADEALIEALEGGLEAGEAEVGVEHGEGAGELVGIGEDGSGAIAVGDPDFEAFGETGGEGIGGGFGGVGRVEGLAGSGSGFGLQRRIGEVDGKDGSDADVGAEVGVVVSGSFRDMVTAKDGSARSFEESAQTGGGGGKRMGRDFELETGH